LVALLNEFHQHMVEVVFGSGGTLDKYTGDGLMAYFGAPMTQADHAGRAVECALAMQKALARFNLRRKELGEEPLRMRIGIHSGTAIVGSIGAPHRREFTVVGDTVNVASRLEQVAKHLEKDIVISEATRQRTEGRFFCEPLETVPNKGKTTPLSLYVPKRAPFLAGASGGQTVEKAA
jgi:adenylate cyclase